MRNHGSRQQIGLILKICITWLCLIVLVGFYVATRSATDTVTLTVLPEMPKTREPVVATFSIKNPSVSPSTVGYQLYVNGSLAEDGVVSLSPYASSRHQYAYENPLERGKQVNFVLKTGSESGDTFKTISLPAYPPQLMSSFVSFATFSTSVMSSMISAEYFTETFGISGGGINTSLIISAALIVLLIFLELTQVITSGKGIVLMRRYRLGLGNLAAILCVIFIGMVFTKIVMILST